MTTRKGSLLQVLKEWHSPWLFFPGSFKVSKFEYYWLEKQSEPPNQLTNQNPENLYWKKKNPTYFPIRIFLFGPFPKKSSGAGLFLTGLIGLESGGLKEKILFSIKPAIFREQNQAISLQMVSS